MVAGRGPENEVLGNLVDRGADAGKDPSGFYVEGGADGARQVEVDGLLDQFVAKHQTRAGVGEDAGGHRLLQDRKQLCD